MRVTRNTTNLLVFNWTRWPLALLSATVFLIGVWFLFRPNDALDGEALIVGVTFIPIGGAIFCSASQRRRLTLNRDTGIVELRAHSLLGTSVQKYPLGKLRAARCERVEDEHPYYNLFLDLDGEALPLNSSLAPWVVEPEAHIHINNWLANHAPVDSPPPTGVNAQHFRESVKLPVLGLMPGSPPISASRPWGTLAYGRFVPMFGPCLKR